MVRGMIGNELGVASVDKSDETLLASITAEGANTFTASAADLRNLSVGMAISFYTKADGTLIGTRNITQINSATGVVTYDGADLATTTAEGVYLTGSYEPATPPVVNAQSRDGYTNFNGGASVDQGMMHPAMGSIAQMRARLTAISATTYSSAELDKMTYNDLVYALRVNDTGGIK